MRFRLTEPAAASRYPILDELRTAGFADYLITPLEFMNGEVHVLSFATRSPDGLLVSERVAQQVPSEWRSLGRHQLRGVEKPVELFTL